MSAKIALVVFFTMILLKIHFYESLIKLNVVKQYENEREKSR
jgi:hypothetical protein